MPQAFAVDREPRTVSRPVSSRRAWLDEGYGAAETGPPTAKRRSPVDREQLKASQAPLKARYRQDPAAAVITLRAQGRLGDEEVSCSVETGRAMVAAGLHPATGGDGSHACSGDMLLQALVACAGVTLRSVAINRGLRVDAARSGLTAKPRSASPPFVCCSTFRPRRRRTRSRT